MMDFSLFSHCLWSFPTQIIMIPFSSILGRSENPIVLSNHIHIKSFLGAIVLGLGLKWPVMVPDQLHYFEINCLWIKSGTTPYAKKPHENRLWITPDSLECLCFWFLMFLTKCHMECSHYIFPPPSPLNLQVHVSCASNTQLKAQYWPLWHLFFNTCLTFISSLPFEIIRKTSVTYCNVSVKKLTAWSRSHQNCWKNSHSFRGWCSRLGMDRSFMLRRHLYSQTSVLQSNRCKHVCIPHAPASINPACFESQIQSLGHMGSSPLEQSNQKL